MEEQEAQIVNNACYKLGEHFDSVRIFVTKHCGASTNTFCYTTGLGNFYSQIGQINEWKAIQDQTARENAKQ